MDHVNRNRQIVVLKGGWMSVRQAVKGQSTLLSQEASLSDGMEVLKHMVCSVTGK